MAESSAVVTREVQYPEAAIAEHLMEKVRARIDAAIHKNRVLLILIATLLSAFFFTGLALLIFAIAFANYPMAIAGGILELAIFFPIRTLMQLRRDDIRLQFIPEAIHLAAELGSAERKVIFEAIVKLLERTP